MSEWKHNLAKFFIHILEGEKAVEYQRQILGRIPNFELFSAFQRFDRENKKFVSINNLRLFLRENLVKFSEIILRETVSQYDRDNDNALNFEEFTKILLTSMNDDLRSQITQRQVYGVRPNEYLYAEIEDQILEILIVEMNLIDELMLRAEEVKCSFGFKLREAFEMIDYLNYGYITEEEILLFLKKSGYLVSEYELKFFINRADKDNDNKISFEDFRSLFFIPEIKTREREKEYDYSIISDINKSQKLKNSSSKSSLKDIDLSSNSKNPHLENSRKYNEKFSSQKNYGYDNSINGLSSLRTQHSFSSDHQYRPSRKDFRSESVIDYENTMLRFFKKLISYETKAECQREGFAIMANTHFVNIFRYFDYYQVGSIRPFDLKEGLNNLNVFVTQDEIRLIFKRYNMNKNDKFSYQEFSRMICPCREEYNSLLQGENSFKDSEVPASTLKGLSDLFRLLINNENQIENLRRSLTDRPLFVVSEAFSVLKGKIKNYIIRQDVYKKIFIYKSYIFILDRRFHA
jgi:Ca2+-binding EF-hand superfamily protein